MFDNINALLVDLVDVIRANVSVVTATIRDKKQGVSSGGGIVGTFNCWFDPSSSQYIYNDLVGQYAAKSAIVYFVGNTPIKEGDRLKRYLDGSFWAVKEVKDYSSQGMHMYCVCQEIKAPM